MKTELTDQTMRAMFIYDRKLDSLRRRRYLFEFGERVLSIFLVKTIAAIFDYTVADDWGKKETSTEGLRDSQKGRSGKGWGNRNNGVLSSFIPTPPPYYTL